MDQVSLQGAAKAGNGKFLAVAQRNKSIDASLEKSQGKVHRATQETLDETGEETGRFVQPGGLI